MLGSHPRWGWKSYFSLTLLNSIRFLSGLLGQGADFFIEMLLKSLILEAGLPSFDVAEVVKELKEGGLDKISRILSRLEKVIRVRGGVEGFSRRRQSYPWRQTTRKAIHRQS